MLPNSQIPHTVSPVRLESPHNASNPGGNASNPGGQSHSDPTSQTGQNSVNTTQNQLKNHVQTPHEKAVTDAIRTIQNSLADIQANQNTFDNRQLKYEERLSNISVNNCSEKSRSVYDDIGERPGGLVCLSSPLFL